MAIVDTVIALLVVEATWTTLELSMPSVHVNIDDANVIPAIILKESMETTESESNDETLLIINTLLEIDIIANASEDLASYVTAVDTIIRGLNTTNNYSIFFKSRKNETNENEMSFRAKLVYSVMHLEARS